MPAQEGLRRIDKLPGVEGGPNTPSEALGERVADMAAEQAVAVATRDGVEARVEAGIDLICFADRQFERQPGVQGIAQGLSAVGPFDIGRGDLPGGVSACVGAPCQDDRATAPAKITQGLFQGSLDGLAFACSAMRSCGLTLAARKGSSVVRKDEFVTFHSRE